ncbi:MAG: LysR family transcriptional regulator [Burkholderiaceae bacterium]|jgi:DNA-binding transcriptional LysR family regulator|nr:LysR family transcriptional regulator [Burkholderiaceae bacterium]MBP7660948.1 LysR family transcriptional regulator [Burkholderiaceae bacterium]
MKNNHGNTRPLATHGQIDLKRMRHILEAARGQSITTAAETLGLTQSALSRSLAEVEAALGTALFERLPRGIRLTPAGERFVAGATRVLGDVEQLVSQVRQAGDPLGTRLRIGIAPSGYVSHASASLVDFSREHPRVAVEIVPGSTQALCPRLLNGEFDLIVGSSSYLKRWREVEIRPLVRMHLACMVRPAHPLAAAHGGPREIDVLAYPLILPESIEPIYSDIAQRFAHHGLPPFQPRYLIDDFDLVRRIVAATDAVYPLMHPDPQFGRLGRHFALLRDALSVPSHFISLAYASVRPRSAAALAFEALITRRLARSGGSA